MGAEVVGFHLACSIDTVKPTEETALRRWAVKLTHKCGRRIDVDGQR